MRPAGMVVTRVHKEIGETFLRVDPIWEAVEERTKPEPVMSLLTWFRILVMTVGND